MRVAVISGSLATGIRIASEVERLPGVEVLIVDCNVRMRSPLFRWLRELALALKSFPWCGYARKLWSYRRSGKLVILDHTLNDSESLERLKSLECDIGLHAANVIYRQPTIDAFRLGILNAHIGILPEYRGRSVAEWSILYGDPTGVTVFFIDSGIDTGSRIILRERISPRDCRSVRSLKTMLFGFDAILYRQALAALASNGFRYTHNEVSRGKRYYVMSKILSSSVENILKAGVP